MNYPHRLALFCKTYSRDIDRFALLVESVRLHNVEGLPFVACTPERDADVFRARFPDDAIVWTTDEALTGGSMDDGWTQQQIVKFHVRSAAVADHYVMLDSDFYFVRPFRTSHFLTRSGVPYFVLHEGARARYLNAIIHGAQHGGWEGQLEDAAIDEGAWQQLDATNAADQARRIQLLFRRDGPCYAFMPGPIWSARVLDSMEREWLEPAGLTFHDLIAISPWEYHWYGEWVLHRQPHQIFPIDPRFWGFVSDEQILSARQHGITEGFIGRFHLGIHLASNHQQIQRLDDHAD